MSNWGVVQELVVEADTKQALIHAVSIATIEFDSATHYRVTQCEDGSNKLMLMWHEASESNDTGHPLPFELKGAEELADFAWKWLHKSGEYPRDYPDTDGSVKRGFRVTQSDSAYDYCIFEVKPEYIVYGK